MMTPQPGIPESGTDASGSIGHLHHVGHVVHDMEAAIALYRRLGFTLPPPTYPALPPQEGAAPRPFGAGNTHVDFPDNFVELATALDEGGAADVGAEAETIPIHAPIEVLPQLTEKIARTAARLAAALDRFEGLHILVFQTPDVDAAAARLTTDGVAHTGANRIQRPVEDGNGSRMEPVGYLEVDSDPSLVPEGRLAVAENTPKVPNARYPKHPNGATSLVESVLCVPTAELAGFEHRYATYLRCSAHDERGMRVFDFGDSRLVLIADSDLEALLPGEQVPALPAFVAYAVTVRDTTETQALVEAGGFPVKTTGDGDLFVPATAALGTAVIFRPGG